MLVFSKSKVMDYTPKALYQRFDPGDLIRHFMITPHLRRVPQQWQVNGLAGYWIACHPDLPVNFCFSASKSLKVCFLGDVIDPVLKTFNRPAFDHDMQAGFADLETLLERLSGRFVCFASCEGESRIYPDASGCLPILYCPDQQIIASSMMVIPYHDPADDDHVLINAHAFHERNGIYPFGVTARQSVYRLLPNHYLDSKCWQATRFWSGKADQAISYQEAVFKIGDIISDTIDTILGAYDQVYASLTAGVDSRTLLACTSEQNRKKIQYFSWELPDEIALRDIAQASDLINSLGLQYQCYPYEEASEEDQLKWLYRTSLNVGEIRGQAITTTVSTMNSDQPYIAGNVSLVTLGKYWRAGDEALSHLNPEDLLERLRITPLPRLLKAAESWLAELDHCTVREVTDLLYLEQRVGCWGSEIGSGHADGPFHLYPLSNRRIFEYSFAFGGTQDERRQKQLLLDVIKQRDDSLMQWPFNGKMH